MLVAGFPTGSFQANCYLLAAGHGSSGVVVDPGEDAVPRLTTSLAEHAVRPIAVLLTHGHFDHAAAAGAVCRKYGIPAYLSPADHYMLDDPAAALGPGLAAVLAGRSFSGMRPPELRSWPADGVLELADLVFDVLGTPGHTPGSVSLRAPGDRARPDIVLTGDTLFAGSIGRTDLPGGSAEQLLDSIRTTLLPLSDDAFVLPGQGPSSTIGAERGANPFLRGLDRSVAAAEPPAGAAASARADPAAASGTR